VWSSSTVVPSGFGPSSVFTTGAPHSAAKRMACLRYSTLISGLISGQCDERPDNFTPDFAQAREYWGEGLLETGDLDAQVLARESADLLRGTLGVQGERLLRAIAAFDHQGALALLRAQRAGTGHARPGT